MELTFSLKQLSCYFKPVGLSILGTRMTECWGNNGTLHIGETFPFSLIWNFSIYRCVILAGMMHTHKNWLTLTTLVMLEKSGKIVATCEINRGKYMGSRRYGISLWAFNLIHVSSLVSECSRWVRYKVEHEKRNFHMYKQPCLFYYKNILMTNFSGWFSEDFGTFSKKFQRFSKSCLKARQTFPNIFWRFPKIAENFWR